MKDEFLTQFQQEPDPTYSDRLWSRLQQVAPEPEPATAAQPARRRPLRLAFSLAALVALFVTLAASSPVVRAQIEAVWQQFGGISFKETAVYPGDSGTEVTIVENEKLAGPEAQLVEDARKRLGLNVNLPLVPDRFTLLDEVIYGQIAGTSSATFLWQDSRTPYVLVLDVRRYDPEINWVVAPGSTEEVLVNGRPAALTRGGWNADTQEWDDAEGAQVLQWNQDGIAYSLTMFGDMLSPEEFMAIAESIE